MIEFSCKAFAELSLQELYNIMVLRQEVFVVEQNCPYLDADGKDEASYHLLGYENGEIIAYTRLTPKGITYPKHPSIGRVLTTKKARGKGLGNLLMEESIAYCEKIFGEEAIKISAQCYLLKFYNALGFETIGEEYLEDGIPHISMICKKK